MVSPLLTAPDTNSVPPDAGNLVNSSEHTGTTDMWQGLTCQGGERSICCYHGHLEHTSSLLVLNQARDPHSPEKRGQDRTAQQSHRSEA